MPRTSTRNGEFYMSHTTQEWEMGMVARIRSYTCPFITANQAIKALGKVDYKLSSKLQGTNQEIKRVLW